MCNDDTAGGGICTTGVAGFFSGVKITRILIRTTPLRIKRRVLVVNPASKIIRRSVRRVHFSCGPMREIRRK